MCPQLGDERHFRNSTYREKLVEHLFIGELLRFLWTHNAGSAEVLKPEVDNAGYDIVLVRGKIIRHVQLKASIQGARTVGQSINTILEEHASGCVVWIVIDNDLRFKSFGWYGADEPGKPLPDISFFKSPKQTRANSKGIKSVRANARTIPKAKFEFFDCIGSLVEKLFGERFVDTA